MNSIEMCCLCLKNDTTLKNICRLDSDNVRIADKFNYCMPEIENYAKQNVTLICSICRDHLTIYYNFKCDAIRNYKHFINYVCKNNIKGSPNASKSLEEPVCVFVESKVHSNEQIENKLIKAETNSLSSNDEEDPLDIKLDSEIDESVILHKIPKIEKQVRCTICPEYFPNQHSLQLHIKDHHIDKPFICTICQLRFVQKCYLTRHYKVHEKPFTCSVCQNKYSQKQALDIHMRLHTGERPFSCTVCEKKFADRGNLSLHLRMHSGEKNEKRYTCVVCPKQFPRKYDLNVHLRKHTGETPFSCEYCPKQFPRQYDLNVHLRKHTGEKPFSCEYCPKQFKHRKSMTIHMKMHNQGRQDKFNTHKKVRNNYT